MKGTAPGMTIEENLSLAHSRTTVGPLSFAPQQKERSRCSATGWPSSAWGWRTA